ncbi:MAG: Peptide deformylase [Phycisphaerae bacterium]|nr:Peptide deformylase [Phycisphaerae bacterium]
MAAVQASQLRMVFYPDRRLRQVCSPITDFGPHWQEIGMRMLEIMKAAHGVGLAGPQVGVMQRIFVCNHTGEPADDLILLNPQLDQLQGEISGDEGCLSIPQVLVKVTRAFSCRVTAQDSDGKSWQRQGEELLSRIWQHEHDHLHGRLILDYMDEASRKQNLPAMTHLESIFKG